MVWLELIGQLILGFGLGTVILWICFHTVNTQNATIKAALIYNGVMAVLWAVVLGTGLIFFSTQSSSSGTLFLVTTIVSLVISFVLLMRIYDISFLSTIWLVVAMWAVQAGAEWLLELAS